MRIRRRAKRRKTQRRPAVLAVVRLPLAALIVAALGLWVMLPFGGVTLWARDAILLSVVAAIVLLGWLGATPRDHDPASPMPSDRRWILGMVLFLAWAFFQMIPLPAVAVHNLQPGWHVFNQGLPWETSFRSLAVNRVDGFYSLGLWIAPAILAAVLARQFGERGTARVLAHVIVGLGVFQACAALAIPGMLSSWWDTVESRRLLGTFPNPNAFGGLLVLTAPVTLGLLLTLQSRLLEVLNGHWKRLLALPSRHHLLLIEWIWVFLAFVAQAVTLIASGSRGAVSVTLVAIAILFAAYIVASKSSRGIALQMTALLLAAILALATGGGLYLLLQRFDMDALWTSGLAGRIALWRATLRMIGAFPLGVGAGAFPAVFPAFEPRQFGAARIYYAHNDYLQWTAEFGIPGLILLILLLAGLIRRGACTVRVPGARYSAWIWRGAAAGVMAALAHGIVDFNLTVYPGVRVIFFMVCGLMLGASRQCLKPGNAARGAGSNRVATPPRRALWRVAWVLAAGLAVGAWLVGPVIGRIRTAYRVEGARRVLGLPRDNVFWVPPPWIPPDQALATLAEARERMPRTARYAYGLAVGRLMHHEEERRMAVERLRRRSNGMMDADARYLQRMVDLAMRWELRQALEFAREHLDHAVALAPWDADMRAFAGYVNARLADWEAGTPAGEAYRRAAVRYMEGALRLTPYDVAVLMQTCRAAASLLNASMRVQDDETMAYAERQLIRLGQSVVDIDRTKTVEVLEVWETAGMAIDRLADLETLPLPILREVYRYVSGQHQASEARRVLNLLTARFADGAPGEAGMDRLFLDREKYRWLIWDRNWPAYRDALHARRDTWRQRQHEALTQEEGAGRLHITRRIHLRAVDRGIGLHVDHLLDLSQLEWDRGATHEAMMLLSRALALYAGREVTDAGTVQAFKTWRDTVHGDREHYAARWLACRLLRADRRPREAALGYRRLREHPRLPLRFRHRIDLETAAAWMEAGNTDAATAVIRSVIMDGIDDPDVLRAWIEHGLDETLFRGPDGLMSSASERLVLLQPDHEMGVRYMGERVELVGLTLEPYGAVGSGQTRVRSYWRFYDRVPSDLRLRMVARAPDGYAFDQRTSWFGRDLPDRFAAGEPRAGSILILNTSLPAQARAGDRLILTLHAGDRRLSSDEGLLRLDINEWTRLLGRPKPPQGVR